jgi:hypothetical protein
MLAELQNACFVHRFLLLLKQRAREFELAADVVYSRQRCLESLRQLPVGHLIVEFIELANLGFCPRPASGCFLACEVQFLDAVESPLIAAFAFLFFPVGIPISCEEDVFMCVARFLQPFACDGSFFLHGSALKRETAECTVRGFLLKEVSSSPLPPWRKKQISLLLFLLSWPFNFSFLSTIAA